MAPGDPSNQLQIISGGYVKDAIIGGMPGPLPEPQPRHWMPDERDNFISWLRGEFAAANAIIDSVCHHLQMVGKPGEYDFVLSSIQKRRLNWTVVLHMQQYFSVAEVQFALQRVVWLRQSYNCEPTGMPPLFASPENGGNPPWKEGPNYYPRSDSHIASAPHQKPVQDDQVLARKNSIEGLRKAEQQERRGIDLGDQGRQHQPGESSSIPDTEQYTSRNPPDQAEQSTDEVPLTTTDSSLSDTSPVPIPPPQPVEISDMKDEESSDQGPQEQEEMSSTNLDGSEAHSSDKVDTPFFHISSKEEEDRRRAGVKLTRTYRCLEQIDGKMVNTADGLELHEIVLDQSESTQLASLIQDIRTAGKRGEHLGSGAASYRKGGKGRGREQLHFGQAYHHSLDDHKRRSSLKDDSVPPLPAFLEAVIDRLVRWHVIPPNKRPDCCIVNFMEEGDYLPPHVDNSLERPYCTIALQSECSLVFGHTLTTPAPGDLKGPLQISLPIGSVLVSQRSSADTSKHGVESSPNRRILITFGKVQSIRHSRVYSNIQTSPGGATIPSSNSWGSSTSHNGSSGNRQGSSNVQHNSSARPGGGGFLTPFKTRKYPPGPHSTPSSSGGVLPNPPARPPPPAQIVPNVANPVPPMFGPTPGPPGAGGAFPPPSLPIPPWSPLPRPPIANRPPSAGTGVFFPSGGSSSGPGRPVNLAPPRRSGNSNVPPGPPVLQKTNSAPASFASLEASAIAAAAAAASSSTPPGKPSKSSKSGTSTTTSSTGPMEKTLQVSSPPGRAGWSPSVPVTNPQDPSATLGKASPSSSDPQSEANGSKSAAKGDNPAVRSPGRSLKSSVTGHTGTKAVAVSNNGGGAS